MKQLLFILIFVLLSANVAFAAWTPNGGTVPGSITITSIPTSGLTTLNDWYDLVQNVIGWLFVIAIIVGVAMLIIAGIMYITSRGAGQTATAGKIVIYAVVGIAVAALAWAIVNVVGNYFVAKQLVH